ncbi:unnamed protein product [Pylaiella littoralis]
MTAVTAVVVVAGVVASGVAHAHAPPVRAPIYEPRRLSWEYHESDLDERDGWRRSYRMDKQTFYKLAELLRPLLEVNTYFAQVRLAVALRILAGGSYWCAALMFGLSLQSVYLVLWQVIDAINATPAVGKFYFPQDEANCLRHAERFKVGWEHTASFTRKYRWCLYGKTGTYFGHRRYVPETMDCPPVSLSGRRERGGGAER